MSYLANTLGVRWPVIRMPTRSGTPFRTKFRIAVRRRSWGIRPGHPAIRHAAFHAWASSLRWCEQDQLAARKPAWQLLASTNDEPTKTKVFPAAVFHKGAARNQAQIAPRDSDSDLQAQQ
jgi:hypothetical protein